MDKQHLYGGNDQEVMDAKAKELRKHYGVRKNRDTKEKAPSNLNAKKKQVKKSRKKNRR